MVTTQTPENITAPQQPKQAVHLAYLDGVRGLAALYVVFYHIIAKLEAHHRPIPSWLEFAHVGRIAVDVFIVLSGYCLMLPVVRSASRDLSGGTIAYLKRRGWRILPPYYAALTVSLGLLFLSGHMHHGLANAKSLDNVTKPAIVAHYLMVHNLSLGWAYQVNAPLWSVATEWQIYFFLPLALLPVWRRYGIVAMMSVAWAIGLVGQVFGFEFAEASRSWLLGLFSLGAAAAAINFERGGVSHAVAKRSLACAGLFLAAMLGMIATTNFEKISSLGCIVDSLAGFATAAMLIYCTSVLKVSNGEQHGSGLVKVFESRPAVGIGKFSYSLYLMHGPVLAILYSVLSHMSTGKLAAILATAGVVAAMISSYVFYLVFERPFIVKKAKGAARPA